MAERTIKVFGRDGASGPIKMNSWLESGGSTGCNENAQLCGSFFSVRSSSAGWPLRAAPGQVTLLCLTVDERNQDLTPVDNSPNKGNNLLDTSTLIC
jgi:hypothetical protein